MDLYLRFGHELMTTLSDRDLTRLQQLIVRLLAKVDDVGSLPAPHRPGGTLSPAIDPSTTPVGVLTRSGST